MLNIVGKTPLENSLLFTLIMYAFGPLFNIIIIFVIKKLKLIQSCTRDERGNLDLERSRNEK